MRIFITGASGFIGSVVTKKLISLGHEVIGLARSNESAVALTNAGAKPLRGSLEDIDILKKGAGESDGVINLGFNHDFSQFGTSIQVELRAIEVMGEVL
ncbi:MAG: NAD-dependent epimerase/dehydratase family protein, partial [Treponema sp.]|nr:NAD-dependent epimerase/dehydratase family protein [Treponema sp.]